MLPGRAPPPKAGDVVTREDGRPVAVLMRTPAAGDKIVDLLTEWKVDYSDVPWLAVLAEPPGERWASIGENAGLTVHFQGRGWWPSQPVTAKVRA